MQWFKGPNRRNVDNQNNIRLEMCRHFRNIKGEYLRDKSMNLQQTVKTGVKGKGKGHPITGREGP